MQARRAADSKIAVTGGDRAPLRPRPEPTRPLGTIRPLETIDGLLALQRAAGNQTVLAALDRVGGVRPVGCLLQRTVFDVESNELRSAFVKLKPQPTVTWTGSADALAKHTWKTLMAEWAATDNKYGEVATALEGVRGKLKSGQLSRGDHTLKILPAVGKKAKELEIKMTITIGGAAAQGAVVQTIRDVARMGTEFTFTNAAIRKESKEDGAEVVGGKAAEKALDDWWKLAKVLPGVTPKYTEENAKFKTPEFQVTYPDNWWYRAGLDPGCIETQTAPMTLVEAEAMKDRVQNDLFSLAKQAGLDPDATHGGGHIHLDVASTFGTNGKLFRDFVVDFENHALAIEAFEHDPTNAPLLAQQPGEVKAAFRRAIGSFENEERKTAPTPAEVAKAIEDIAYALKPDKEGQDVDDKLKYNALNYRHMVKEGGLGTVEIRALRSQRTFEEFLEQGNLFLRRIEWLSKQKRSPGVSLPQGVSDDQNQAPSLGEVIKSLDDYVAVLQLDVEKFRDLAQRNRREWQQAAKRDQT